jgi:hypothetical protein
VVTVRTSTGVRLPGGTIVHPICVLPDVHTVVSRGREDSKAASDRSNQTRTNTDTQERDDDHASKLILLSTVPI